MAQNFTWVEIYHELALALLNWQDKQTELIAFLEDLRKRGYVITSMQDKNSDGESFLLSEIDPFSFMGIFNRGIRNDQRIAILAELKKYFQLQSSLPADFAGIPVLNNMKSRFFPHQDMREPKHIPSLWRVFGLALGESPQDNDEFWQAFDDALKMRLVNITLTMGLFWIRPDTFLSLDSVNRSYLSIKLPQAGLNAGFYSEILKLFKSKGKSFPELSLEAWKAATNEAPAPIVSDGKLPDSTSEDDIDYWLVGAYWDDRDPADQTSRFLTEGIWENGYRDRLLDEVKSMQVGDKIAIKAAGTQKRNLPFDANNQTVSRMTIKAVGTIVANRGDGRTIEVEWDQNFKEKDWFFYTNRSTLWHLRVDKDYKLLDLSERLRDFVWSGKPQDYDWWVKRWGYVVDGGKVIVSGLVVTNQPYSIEDMVASGVFLNEIDLEGILKRLESKKAMILQGPPGVGKTYIARKLAYALMKEVDGERLEMVQFHQSYSYDDFVRGYRPVAGEAGRFGLQNGVFYEFCQKAINDPDREYVFIIDEINRGNLSQIFGELLMLIEHDKRSLEFAVPLIYRNDGEARFFIPPNLYLIGLMNVADRSLAMVDYALRRRFVFTTLKPQYENEQYRQWLITRSMDDTLVNLILERMTVLNKEIKEDPLLGENYQVGHSFFCPKGNDFAGLDRSWYEGVVRTEIVPLLKEYWFDNQTKAEEVERRLLA